MLRVLLVCEYASLNGGERSLLAMLDELLARAGDEFEFVAAAPGHGPLADEFARRGIAVEPCDDEEQRLPQAARRERLAQIARRVRPALLHANSLAMSRLSGPVADELALPSIGHLRDIVGLSRRAIDDINRHARILAVSRATLQYHAAAGLAVEKAHVLHNGVDLQRFSPRAGSGYLHAELGLADSARLLGAIGQLGMRKGLDVLLAAAALVVERLPDAHFVLVGRRHSHKAEAIAFEERLQTMSSAPPLAGHVHFLGERGDVPQLLRELTLLLHAARQEPLGRVLLEAAACGNAIVATTAGGTAEIFPHPSQARLVPVDDVDRLASETLRLLEDESSRRALGQAARTRAEQAFNVRHAAAQLAVHYRDAAARRAL